MTNPHIHVHSLQTSIATPLSKLIVLQNRLSLEKASRTEDEATVTSLLDSGTDPDFRDIVRKELKNSLHSVLVGSV